ncbi:MAG: hypothetical protein L3J39_12660 [Verrucomicrobiales bacterium]|nr:hypothetical protein [Verrucomicrobiales bacterium]
MPATDQSAATPLDDLAPRRSFLRMASKIIAAHLIFILIIFVPLAIHENRQAQRDWDDFKSHWEAKGEIFDLEKLIPPEIPDEENFASAPIIAEVFEHPDDNRLSSIDLDTLPRITNSNHSYNIRKRALGAYRDELADYQQSAQHSSSNSVAAKAILNVLEPLSPIFLEFEQACLRPKTKIPLDYSKPTKIDRPYIRPLLSFTRTLSLRARSHIALSQSSAAKKDILTLLRILLVFESDDSFISHLLSSALFNITLPVIWESLHPNIFTSSDLRLIKKSLEKLAPEKNLVTTIRFERAIALDLLKNHPEEFYASLKLTYFEDYSDIAVITQVLRHIGLSQAFLNRNKLTFCRFFQDHYLTRNDKVLFDWVNMKAASQSEADFTALKHHPYLSTQLNTTLLASFSGDAFYSIAERTAHTSTRIDLARIAIALELYHRQHGNYPTTLAPLTPTYLDTIPNDLITDKPLHYRIKADGTPIIYSVGLNQIDEGGLLKEDHTLGDWVWQYTLPKNFDEAEWEK